MNIFHLLGRILDSKLWNLSLWIFCPSYSDELQIQNLSCSERQDCSRLCFFKVCFECVWGNRWKKMQSLGSKKMNYNFMCKKLSHLGTICSTGLFHFIQIKVKNLTSSVLLQSWKLIFSNVTVTVYSNFCILVASFQWVYFGLLFQIVVPCELAHTWLILKLKVTAVSGNSAGTVTCLTVLPYLCFAFQNWICFSWTTASLPCKHGRTNC